MKWVNVFMILLCSISMVSCSDSTPNLVYQLKTLQIPVVQSKANDEKNNIALLNSLHSKNTLQINALTGFLKNSYIKNSKSKEIFDTHSLTHQVYTGLTNLEQARMINEQYYNDKNIQGILALNKVLSPLIIEIKSYQS